MAVAPVTAAGSTAAAALCAEQLYVTLCEPGDSLRNQAGFQVRAASTSDAELLKFALDHSGYELPLDLWGQQLTTRQAPRRLALAVAPGNRMALIHTTYLPQDARSRSNNYFTHILVYPQLTALQALQTWGSPDWQIGYPRGASKELRQFAGLPRNGKLSDQTLTGFLNEGAALLADRDLATLIYPERLHGNVPRKRDLLRQALEGCLRSLEAARQQGPRSHFYIQAEPGLTALLLYGVCRLLPPTWVQGLTFSTYENAHSALRRYKLTHVIGTFAGGHRPKGLEPELTSKRGYGLDTLQPDRSSSELKVQAQPVVDHLIDLAARGDFKHTHELLRYCDEQVSLASLSASQEVHAAAQRLPAGTATFADLQALRRSPGGRQIHDKHEGTVWKLVREWSLTSDEVRKEYTELLRKHAGEIKNRAAADLTAGAATWQQHWDLLKHALEGKQKTLRTQLQEIVESSGQALRQAPLAPLRLAILNEWRDVQHNPSDFPEAVRLLLVPRSQEEIAELQRANAPKEWLALALHQALTNPVTQAAALQQLRDAGQGVLRTFRDEHHHLPDSQQSRVIELFRQRRDEESPEFFNRLRKADFPLPVEIVALLGTPAEPSREAADDQAATTEPAPASPVPEEDQPESGQQTHLVVIAAGAFMALIVSGLLLLISNRGSSDSSQEPEGKTEVAREDKASPAPPKVPEKPKEEKKGEEKPPPKPVEKPPAKVIDKPAEKPPEKPRPPVTHPDAVVMRMLIEAMHNELNQTINVVGEFLQANGGGEHGNALRESRNELAGKVLKELEEIKDNLPPKETRKRTDNAAGWVEGYWSKALKSKAELHSLCNSVPQYARPGKELLDAVQNWRREIQAHLAWDEINGPDRRFHEFLIEAVLFEAHVKCGLTWKDAQTLGPIFRRYLSLFEVPTRTRSSWKAEIRNAHEQIATALVDYLVDQESLIPRLPRNKLEQKSNGKRLERLLDRVARPLETIIASSLPENKKIKKEEIADVVALKKSIAAFVEVLQAPGVEPTEPVKPGAPAGPPSSTFREPSNLPLVRLTAMIRDDLHQFLQELGPSFTRYGLTTRVSECQSALERIDRGLESLREVPPGADDAITRGRVEEIVRGIAQTYQQAQLVKVEIYKECCKPPPPYPSGNEGVVLCLKNLFEQARQQSSVRIAGTRYDSGLQQRGQSFLAYYIWTRARKGCALVNSPAEMKCLEDVIEGFSLEKLGRVNNTPSMVQATNKVIAYMIEEATARGDMASEKECGARLRKLLLDAREDFRQVALDGSRERVANSLVRLINALPEGGMPKKPAPKPEPKPKKPEPKPKK